MTTSPGPSLLSIDGRPRLQTATRAAALAASGLTVAYAVSIFAVERGAGNYSTFWDGWLFHVATTLPAFLSAARARVDQRYRPAWICVTAGIVLNTLANLSWTYYDQNLDPVPYPGPADVMYLASYLAFAVALVIVTQRMADDATRASRLDGLVVGLGTGAVAVALWLGPTLSGGTGTAELLVSLAYPLFDVVFVVVLAAGLAPHRYRPPATVAAFMVGGAVFAVGDVVYLRQATTDTYVPQTWLELTWAFGILLFGLAPWLTDSLPRHRHRDVSPGLAALPATIAMVSLVVLTLGLTGRVPRLASWLAMASIAAALMRMALTVRELRQANQSFREARTDDLTTLMNRRGFVEILKHRLAADHGATAVLMVDLDGFKEVNDSLGHHAGDQLLAIVGERFSRAIGDDAVVARLGGDEFGLTFRGDHGVAFAAAAALQLALADPVSVDGISIRIGASIGIACSPEHGNDVIGLMRAADVAMYDAKQNQRDAAYYSADRDPHSRARLALIEELRTAIDERAFEMHYQPTIDVTTGRTVGMEALIRWRHPTRGLLPPADFIPLAERVGLIPAITRAVLDQSIAHLAATRRAGHSLGLSVNISAKDLVDEDLAGYIRATLDAHDVPASSLTLEITETALSLDPARAERTLTALRSEGIRVSIDDFGVGYSSMSQLLQLPLDELKLDRSFIANLDQDVRARAILSATVELGRTLGLDIVAEGVETSGALDEITDRGVETAQGFYFSQGLPEAAFLEFMRGLSADSGR